MSDVRALCDVARTLHASSEKAGCVASISATGYGTLQTCRRLFYFTRVLFLERVKEEGIAREYGTLFHKGLEEWWKLAGEGDAPWAATDEALVVALAAIAEGSRASPQLTAYDRAKADAMMIAYHTRWSSLVFTRIGSGTEVEFKVPLVDPDGREVKGWFQAGRQDAFVQFDDKHRVSIVEHKTTTADITFGQPYWDRITLDTQSSMYIDSARAAGFDAAEVLYDVARKPDVSPLLATPEDQRTYTKGKGCKECGGSAGGKKGIVQGSGKLPNPTEGMPELTCADCKGTGWKLDETGEPEGPRLYAKHREKSETPEEYGRRVAEEISTMPEMYFKQVSVLRDDAQLREARADLVSAAIEIDGLWSRARAVSGNDLTSIKAREVFQRNTNTCMHVYGRRCDFYDVCRPQGVDPLNSPLYRIRPRQPPKPTQQDITQAFEQAAVTP